MARILEETMTAEEMACPNCNNSDGFGEELLMSLMQEPFNGVAHTCDKCGTELHLSVLIKAQFTFEEPEAN